MELATSAKSAMEKMSDGEFDVIVADYQMPEMNGLELLKAVRGRGAAVSYIIFTGKGREDVAIEALNNGADFYLQKGGDPRSQFAELSNMISRSFERKSAQDLLRESERRFRELLSNAHHAALILDRGGNIEFINEHLLKLTGRAGEDLLKKNWFDLFIPQDIRKDLRLMYEDGLRTGRLLFSRPHVNDIVTKSGSRKRFAWDNTILYDKAGNKIGVASLGEDITEKRVSDEVLRPFVESAHDLMFRYGLKPTRGFVYMNPAAEKITGYTREEHYADPGLSLKIAYPEDAPFLRSLLENPKDAKSPAVFRCVHKSGRIVWVELRLVPVLDAAGEAVAIDGTARDITEQRTMQERIERSSAEYASLVESAPCIICRLKPDGETVFVNSYVESLTGYRPAELIGRNWWDVMYPGELRAEVDGLYSQFCKGDVSGLEMTLRGKDGQPRTLMWTSFNSVDTTRGALVEINGVGTDVTELKLNQDMLQRLNEKLGLLGDITRHDVLNQLSVLIGWVDIATDDSKDEKTKQQLASAKAAAATIRSQLEFTADYQQMGVMRPAWIRADDALREGLSTLALEGVRISSELEGLEVYADPMISKVFHNLVENSLRHGKRVDSIHVYVLKADDGPRIVYEDNGVGITQKDKKLVFERGYGKHTGYGLHLSREILAITGILIQETGEEGKGARFELVLPTGTYRKVGASAPRHP